MAGHPYNVDLILSLAHSAELRELVANPGITVDLARSYLAERGYKIARSSIYRWMKKTRAANLYRLRPWIGCKTDEDTRRKLTAWIVGLAGEQLTRLALYAAFLANVEGALKRQANEQSEADAAAVPAPDPAGENGGLKAHQSAFPR